MFYIVGRVLRASSYKLFNQYKTFILENKAVRRLSSFEILERLFFCDFRDFCVSLIISRVATISV